GLDLHRFDEVDLEVLANPATLEVGHVNAIDEVDVFGVRGAANLKTVAFVIASALQRLHAGAGGESNQRLEGAAFRDVVNHFFRDVDGDFALRHVDRKQVAGDFHGLRGAAHLQGNVNRGQTTHIQVNCGLPQQ